MKYTTSYLLIIVLIFTTCLDNSKQMEKGYYHNNFSNRILVVAHRGDWRNAPENSIRAIENSIKIGADIVEIDVRISKDNQLVLMHDELIDRTTNGKGNVKDLKLDSLKSLNLKNGIGSWTPYKIPTLNEALLAAKDSIIVNIDLKDYTLIDKVIEETSKNKMLNEVIFKLKGNLKQAKGVFKNHLNHIKFMPIIIIDDANAINNINEYLNSEIDVIGFEIIFKEETPKLFKIIDLIKKSNRKIWVNSLWPEMCGGYNDEKAAINSNTFQWYIDHKIDMIQTDRPKILIDFLNSKNEK